MSVRVFSYIENKSSHSIHLFPFHYLYRMVKPFRSWNGWDVQKPCKIFQVLLNHRVYNLYLFNVISCVLCSETFRGGEAYRTKARKIGGKSSLESGDPAKMRKVERAKIRRNLSTVKLNKLFETMDFNLH